MSKRGLSFDEKREKMQSIFFETADVFQLKDLEKLGPKKQVISQSVKEVVQSLVDDSLVECEKVGISNYFWAFPGKSLQLKERAVRKLQEEIEKAQETKQGLLKRKASLVSEGRGSSEGYRSKRAALDAAETTLKTLNQRLSEVAANDPELLEEIRVEAATAAQAVQRWTDNVFNMLSFIKKNNPGITDAVLREGLEIPADFDYLT